MTVSLRQAAGSLLVVGLEGTELAPLERAWLKLLRPAGIILFRRNIENAKQTRALLADATQFCTPHCVRFVDVEGGTVDRLRDALAPIPAVELVARAMRLRERAGLCDPTQGAKTGARRGWGTLVGDGAIPGPQVRGTRGTPSSLAREHGELIARAVKAFGFNSPLAPVFDLGLPASQKVLGTRCAGDRRRQKLLRTRGHFCRAWRRRAWRDAESISLAWEVERSIRTWRRRRYGAAGIRYGSRIWSLIARCEMICRW